jgi:hypothetical protein
MGDEAQERTYDAGYGLGRGNTLEGIAKLTRESVIDCEVTLRR